MKEKKQEGFTLIELLLVIAIMFIIFSSSISNYDKMGRQVELENAVYNLALTMREAQVYGINKKSREDNVSTFGESYRYGVYFNKTTTIPAVSSTKFLIYLDGYRGNSPDGKFTSVNSLNCTGEGNDECYSQVLLTKGNHITGIYFHDGNSWVDVNENSADISFVRPNPDSEILNSAGTKKSSVRILIQDRTEELKACVDIGAAGDISIKGNNNCDV